MESTTSQQRDRGFHRLRVRRIIDETRDARSIVFEVPPALAEVFRYEAGQFLTLEVEAGGGPARGQPRHHAHLRARRQLHHPPSPRPSRRNLSLVRRSTHRRRSRSSSRTPTA